MGVENLREEVLTAMENKPKGVEKGNLSLTILTSVMVSLV